jgi:hypothetical protein
MHEMLVLENQGLEMYFENIESDCLRIHEIFLRNLIISENFLRLAEPLEQQRN